MNRISLSSPYCVLFWSNQTPEKLFLLHRLTVLSIYVNKREDNVTVCNVGCVTTLRNKFPKGHSSYLSLMFIYESDICWCGTSGERKDRDKRVVTKKSHDFTQMVILKKIKIKNEQANGDKWFFRSKGQWIINIHLFYLIRVLCWQVDKKKMFSVALTIVRSNNKTFPIFPQNSSISLSFINHDWWQWPSIPCAQNLCWQMHTAYFEDEGNHLVT